MITTIPPTKYTLEKNPDPKSKEDTDLYLYKNGKQACCPFYSSTTPQEIVAVQKEGLVKTAKDPMQASEIKIASGYFYHPCGTFCQHFNFDTQKIKVKEGEKETVKDTGKIVAIISCGGGMRLPISNVDLNTQEKPASNLTVEKK